MIEGENSINNASPPNSHNPKGRPVDIQLPFKHCFRFARYCHVAHPSNPNVMSAKTGRYGSNTMKALAEPKPSNRTANGPRQHAEANPPAMTAPNNESLPLVVEDELLISLFQRL
jgi:hypothetical protein